MPSLSPRNQLILCLGLAGVGLVLFLGNSYRQWTEGLPLPLDLLGASLFVAAVWFSVDAISRIPRSEAELQIAPQEWQAWLGLAFCIACLVMLGLNAGAFAIPEPIHRNPDAAQAGRQIGLLFAAWAIVSYLLQQRWAGHAHEDERDLLIARQASGWGRLAATLCLVSLALLLGFSDTDRLTQLSYPWLAQLILSSLLVGAGVEYAHAAYRYWQDRRGLDPS